MEIHKMGNINIKTFQWNIYKIRDKCQEVISQT